MRLPRWTVPVLLRLLSLAGLTSAAGDRAALTVGFALSTPVANPTETLSQQPRIQDLSLDLDFILQVANHEFKVPIMPLHLLGKKSWNVYNHDNIEKVKRDEAAAKAREEAKEERMQELDAERRIQILRGDIPTPLPIEDKLDDEDGRESRSYGSGRERKRRKKAGENDTDFEMRVAAEQTAPNNANIEKQIVLRKSDAPLVDRAGHIDLFPQETSKKMVERNPEAEKEAAKKKKEYEDQYTMRFSNAAGFKQGMENPWYSKATAERQTVEEEVHGKDVWGNEDPRRKQREAARAVSNDPLAFMKQGAAQVRHVEKERKRWREEKEKEMRELEVSERKGRKHKRKHEDDNEDGLESFRLDDSDRAPSRRHVGHDSERRHRHKESRRSSHRDDGNRHRHRHRHRD
ncbi:hypothetical protein D0Z07_8903 [Hyphodiscus hymeniophilus]|uniref:CBF1-interacting co-repressor CIR N-terminal domain-containing protein n=1 Tax=Hyphodiscus hymeniophilus TaxID=353542 RepID=A0A9P6SQK9_9HELO|nr:hypothetical protein D0Z07_8903 [Hyphodiscus hymeniophilus]